MTRALVHIGLALAIVIAPTLCCCTARGLNAGATAAPAQLPAPPIDSCRVKKSACCHEAPKDAPKVPSKPTDHKPAPLPAPDSCACNAERPDAAQTESKPTVAAPEPTGERLPLAFATFVAGAPEHIGLLCGLDPPDRAGVDARSAALFERHVMHC